MSKHLQRRAVLAGIAGLALAGPSSAVADDAPISPVAHGALANNALALAFEPPTRTELPDVTLIGGKDRELDISDLKGRTLLMPLWAEWCALCLSELPDFARLQQKYANDKFAIVPILTGTQKRLTTTNLADVLVFLHAGVFELLMENHFGSILMNAMAKKGRGVEIPCNLLIAPDGTVVGREIGAKRSDDETAMLASDNKSQLIKRAEAGETLSLWGKEEGEQFAAAMASGFLAHS